MIASAIASCSAFRRAMHLKLLPCFAPHQLLNCDGGR